MANLTVTYKGQTIAEWMMVSDFQPKTIYTSGKYCEDDITLDYTDTSYEDAIIDRTISGEYYNSSIIIIRSAAFCSCRSLTSVNFPSCKTINDIVFSYCTSLTGCSFPQCQTIDTDAFARCGQLKSAYFPACTSLGSSAFRSCSRLTSASFPLISKIGDGTFQSCIRLKTISFPQCSTIGNYVFRSCSSLATASFPNCIAIYASAFANCIRLKSLYLSKMVTLFNSDAFKSTPIGGYSTTAGTFGSIYVPSSLLASYKASTNWTYFSSRFVGV